MQQPSIASCFSPEVSAALMIFRSCMPFLHSNRFNCPDRGHGLCPCRAGISNQPGAEVFLNVCHQRSLQSTMLGAEEAGLTRSYLSHPALMAASCRHQLRQRTVGGYRALYGRSRRMVPWTCKKRFEQTWPSYCLSSLVERHSEACQASVSDSCMSQVENAACFPGTTVTPWLDKSLAVFEVDGHELDWQSSLSRATLQMPHRLQL